LFISSNALLKSVTFQILKKKIKLHFQVCISIPINKNTSMHPLSLKSASKKPATPLKKPAYFFNLKTKAYMQQSSVQLLKTLEIKQACIPFQTPAFTNFKPITPQTQITNCMHSLPLKSGKINQACISIFSQEINLHATTSS
jgi:hypothetical protein